MNIVAYTALAASLAANAWLWIRNLEQELKQHKPDVYLLGALTPDETEVACVALEDYINYMSQAGVQQDDLANAKAAYNKLDEAVHAKARRIHHFGDA